MSDFSRVILLMLLCVLAARAQSDGLRDTCPDTWAATDALGRTIATAEQVGPPRTGKFVGIFYFLWHGQHGTGGPYDITKILARDPHAMTKPTSPPWGPLHAFHHWGEPLFGYYLSDDAWVYRKHAQMLSDAGVDVVIFDVTNQVTYPTSYLTLCETWTQVRKDGGKTPQIAFLTPFWDPKKVVRTLYDDFYGKSLYSDLWFRWKGKPLIMADPDKVDEDVRSFFTFRKPQPSYFEGPTGPDQWGWLEIHPQHVFHNSAGEPEQMVVGIAQNGQDGKLSAFSEANTYGRSWHGGRKDERPGAVNLGLNFAEQWQRALEVDPQFIFITGWNEWAAMRLDEFAGVREPVMFVDQFTQEYSRDIEPMKGGHSDSYYYQMVDYIRRFKGARAAQPAGPPAAIRIDGRFDDWKAVTPEYLDGAGDTMHRDHPGWGEAGRYVNKTGRNDFVAAKVARDSHSLYFYVRTREAISPRTDPNWMLLFIDIDGDPRTGWKGFDFVVNRRVRDSTVTMLEAWGPKHQRGALIHTGQKDWHIVGPVRYRVAGCEMEIAIPRKMLGLGDVEKPISLTFKWADNVQNPYDALEFAVNGDAAPNGRFRYRYWENRD